MGVDSLQEADLISSARQKEDTGNWVAALKMLTNTDYLSITPVRFLELAQTIDSAARTLCKMNFEIQEGEIHTLISRLQESIRVRLDSYETVIKEGNNEDGTISVQAWEILERRSSEMSSLIVTFRHLLTSIGIDLGGEPPVAKLESGQKIISRGEPGSICLKSQGPWKAYRTRNDKTLRFVEMQDHDWA